MVTYPTKKIVSQTSGSVLFHEVRRRDSHSSALKGVGHLSHDEAMETGGLEFDPRPGHYSRMSF